MEVPTGSSEEWCCGAKESASVAALDLPKKRSSTGSGVRSKEIKQFCARREEFVSRVVEKDLAHPCRSLRFTSRCQDSLLAQSARQADVSQLFSMAQALQALFLPFDDLKD